MRRNEVNKMNCNKKNSNRQMVLDGIMEFSHSISDKLSFSDMKRFDRDMSMILIDENKYEFVNKIRDICKINKIEIDNVLLRFFTYEEKLQKDVIYTFILNLHTKKKG